MAYLRDFSNTVNLNLIFGSLADPTRRDILIRVAKKDLNIGEIAKPYSLSFAAVSKHLKILEKANLVVKHRRGKEQIVRLSPDAIKDAAKYLRQYKIVWNQRLNTLSKLLKKQPKSKFRKVFTLPDEIIKVE